MLNRGRGMGGTFKRGRVWWIRFYHRGRQYRESTGSKKESEANRLLKQRLAETGSDNFVPDEAKVNFEELAAAMVEEYKLNARRSLDTAVTNNINHLRGFFGFDRAIDVTPDRLRSYQLLRLEQGASIATVNRELATFRRMFSLAMEDRKLCRKPMFKLLKGEKIRQGFLEHGDFLKLLDCLPGHLKPFVEFLYYSGWRKGAAKKLEWSQIDMEGRTARLKVEDSKNAEPWVLPLTGRLWEIVQECHGERRLDIKLVFHHKGRGVGDIRKAWATATKAAGLSGFIIHDLRRCAARNLSRAGVPEVVAMKITGHKTNSMYRRYRIVDEDELREALERNESRLKGQVESSKVAVLGRN